MIVFGERVTEVALEEALREVARALRARDPSRLLVEWGMLETALVDAAQPGCDEVDPRTRALRRLALASGEALVLAWDGRDPAPALEGFARRLEALDLSWAPRRLALRTPEGFAWYAAHPEGWIEAARDFLADTGARDVLCVGLRSIGTSLSAAVGAALALAGCRVTLVTLRPRGDPWARRPVMGPEMTRRIAAHGEDGWVLLVDEGPGQSGSSLLGCVEALAVLGVRRDRVGLLPAWDPQPPRFAVPGAAERWEATRRWVVPFERLAGRLLGALPEAVDLSGGAWRWALGAAAGARAQPMWERRKWLLGGGERPVVMRFAGLGRWGEATRRRAERLAEAGLGPEVLALRAGYLFQAFWPGRPLGEPVGREVQRAALDYVRARARWPATGEARVDALWEMLETNARECLGAEGLGGLGRLERVARACRGREAREVDGRLMAWEWVRRPTGEVVKLDAVDHCADHLFPGTQDAAWDAAGLRVELGVARGAIEAALGADDPDLGARLSLYEAAYAAFSWAWATMATWTTDEPAVWRARAARYREHLERVLG